MPNRRLLPYKDLDDHYAAPSSDGTASAGWFRQAQNNLSLMWNATQIQSNNMAGTVDFSPSWVGVTVTSGNVGGYVRVGQIVYLWANATISEFGDEGAGLSDLPVAPSTSRLQMHAGYGYVYDGASTWQPFTAVVSDGRTRLAERGLPEVAGLLFYWATTATDGRVIGGDPMTITGSGRIAVYASYRCDPAPAGYLTEQSYVIDAQ